MHTSVSHRRAFTLVELMIVVGIIGTLAAISIPVVMNALSKARNAAIKSEVDMLHMAIMNYRNQVGTFPPLDPNPQSSHSNTRLHLQRAFPRCQTCNSTTDPNEIKTSIDEGVMPSAIRPFNAMRFWLGGFTNNPLSPLDTTKDREPLYNFDTSRLGKEDGSNIETGAIYFPSKLPQSPFVYIPKNNYGTAYAYPSALLTYTANNTDFTVPANKYRAETNPDTGEKYNPDTFQILCAGRDGEWGTEDDISNFWSSTRGDP